jgi:HD-GYP domain-containing protein (c-di-GMP phosphodiesterase class II)
VREAVRSARVFDLAMQLARRMGMASSERRTIGVAGRLLDIGQMGIPRFITEKPSILSLDEMELMRHHPGMSARILAVADPYWALRADRPHREAFSHAETSEILEVDADEHYDADVVMMLEASLGEDAEVAG